jgi:hypothetical protein
MVANNIMFNFSMRKSLAAIIISALSSPCFATDLYYYDGNVKRVLVVDVQQWANVKSGKSVELRTVSASEKAAKTPSGSPVFRAGQEGAPMALPGGVIVQPKSGDSNAQAKLKAKGYEIERAVGESGALLVKSAEGMSSLQLANQLHESGDFESVSPNWWRERRKK